MLQPQNHTETTEKTGTDVLDAHENSHHLIVWNDDVNTFDWVIKTLMDVCDHEQEQAEQCTLLIHFKGKCIVKEAEFNTLRPMCEGIIDRGINATIEEVVC
ncbi:MAG: ATP-dependent Clp protease adaptor ClpS [Chitinophagaceae bacterium]|nr:ATP-dependent Clp protease adaptor ClpS [Chitinophagaceae bacterium]